MDAGFERWVKALDYLETDVPVYLENTAGGDHAMARHFDTIARLWDHIGDKGIGFCLDTCHAWAAGEALIDAVERIQSITGRIDLVHCNDSRDAAGSGPTVTPISAPARSIPNCLSRSSKPRTRRSSVKPPTRGARTTSPSCATTFADRLMVTLRFQNAR